jgi:hypothetical protein
MFNTDDARREQLFIEKEEARLRLERQTKENLRNNSEHIIQENLKNFDRGREYFKEFDEMVYDQKARVDMLYYQKLLSNIDENFAPEVTELLKTLYSDVYKIYEFVNIEPEVYGTYFENVRSTSGGELKSPKRLPVTTNILNESMDVTEKVITSVVVRYLKENFYNLDETKRQKKFFMEHKELAKKLITEGVDPEEAIEFSIKTIVVENLLRNIAFPFTCWSRIKYLVDDDKSYGDVFDKDALEELVESFNRKLHGVAKIVAIGS